MKLKESPDVTLLVWTTTPWTLISNIAVAVDPELAYLKVRHGDEILVLAEARADAVLGEEYEVIERLKGSDLVGLHYEPPFTYTKPEGKSYVVVAADFVTAEDGTGLVHTAPAFGEDDYNLGREKELAFVNPVLDDGTFCDEIEPWKGRFVIDANSDIIDDLRQRGLLLKAETVTHTYPFCWRCDAPLIYYAHPSWFVKTTAFKDEMVRLNKTINWYPPEFGENRFGRWLENNVDWALSRERYWGTPLNIWICEKCEERYCVGGMEDLRSRAIEIKGEPDLHRPWIDGVLLKCEACGGTMKRVPEVIDCWFDTGGMPYAQYHWPFENEDLFEGQFPADFICEAVDQSRGWFYSLLAISTFMSHEPSFKNCIVTGHIQDVEGLKMSKSRGNVVDAHALMDETGADPLRWYLYASSPVWSGKRFSPDPVKEVARKLFGTLWNVVSFFTLYASIDCFDPRVHTIDVKDRTVMDRWLVSRLNSLILYVDSELEHYEVTRASRAIQEFIIDDLSNWYVRRSRRRYWRREMNEDKKAAYATLYEALETVARLSAPFVPFVAEEIYRILALPSREGAPPSVHLCDYPEGAPGLIDKNLETAMAAVMKSVTLVRAARNRARIRVKQPLASVRLKLRERPEEDVLATLIGHLKEEINVKDVVLEDDLSGFVSYEVIPRFDVLGPRLGGKVKDLKASLAGLDTASILKLESGAPVKVSLDGDEIELGPDDVTIRRTEKEGCLFESDGGNSIVLDTAMTPELLAEGCAREIVSTIQNLRKKSGFEVTDNIRIHISGGELTGRAVEIFGDHIKSETLAESIDAELPEGSEPEKLSVGDENIRIMVERI
jgi:isoleucyl-tRNA synthetase